MIDLLSLVELGGKVPYGYGDELLTNFPAVAAAVPRAPTPPVTSMSAAIALTVDSVATGRYDFCKITGESVRSQSKTLPTLSRFHVATYD